MSKTTQRLAMVKSELFDAIYDVEVSTDGLGGIGIYGHSEEELDSIKKALGSNSIITLTHSRSDYDYQSYIHPKEANKIMNMNQIMEVENE